MIWKGHRKSTNSNSMSRSRKLTSNGYWKRLTMMSKLILNSKTTISLYGLANSSV